MFGVYSSYWDVTHPRRPFSWFNTIQNFFRVLGNQWFTVLPVWIFVICGQLIVLYIKQIEDHLNNLMTEDPNFVAQEVLKSLGWIKQLNFATEIVHQRLRTMFMAVWITTTITLLTSSFYLIHLSEKEFIVLILVDVTNMIDSFVCLCLMSYSSDRMQHAVTRSIHENK